VHTTASDGSVTPGECVELAGTLGLAAIGITDHDTMAGVGEAQARGAELGVEVVAGLELTASHGPWVVHLLGYCPEPGDPGLEALLTRVRASRDERNPQILRRLAAVGCPVSADEVAAEAGSHVVGRPHIAAAMVRKGYVRNFQEAFDKFLAAGGAAYVERRRQSAADVIAAILGARAVPVLAHPGALGIHSAEELDRLVRSLVEVGLRGVEAYYHAHTARQVAICRRVAERQGLVVTGGSDFHGAGKPDIQLGRGMGNMHVPYHLLVGLRAARERL